MTPAAEAAAGAAAAERRAARERAIEEASAAALEAAEASAAARSALAAAEEEEAAATAEVGRTLEKLSSAREVSIRLCGKGGTRGRDFLRALLSWLVVNASPAGVMSRDI